MSRRRNPRNPRRPRCPLSRKGRNNSACLKAQDQTSVNRSSGRRSPDDGGRAPALRSSSISLGSWLSLVWNLQCEIVSPRLRRLVCTRQRLPQPPPLRPQRRPRSPRLPLRVPASPCLLLLTVYLGQSGLSIRLDISTLFWESAFQDERDEKPVLPHSCGINRSARR